MEALVGSSEGAGMVAIESRCVRPEPRAAGLAIGEIS
jgi:hypothetical protein